MTEPAPDADQQAAQPPDGQPPAATPEPDQTDWKAEARKWETRAKDNQRAARELEQQRQASMTETERAIAEAEQRGRSTAVGEFGKRLAQTEFKAAAAARNAEYDVAGALEFVDLARFVGEDGEPDTKAITAAVERLVPTSQGPRPPSFDGGTRTPPKGGSSMNDLIRQAAGRG